MSYLHDNYADGPADKAIYKFAYVCKSHYIDCFIRELAIPLGTLHITDDTY